MTQMDHATQQNAALVEQLSAASASLQDQAQVLAHAVAAFRTDERVEAVEVADAALALPEERLALANR